MTYECAFCGEENKIRRYRYERVYGAFNGRTIRVDGAQAVERSAARYLHALRLR